MRRITLWAFSTVAALVLLFSYRTSTNTPAATTEAVHTTGPAPSGRPDADGRGGTFDGSSVATNWGPVQVRITVADGRITQVETPVSPADDPADAGVTKGALPTLHEQTLAKQSADIDSVSGATFTSAAYKESLQAALDAAQVG
ncbi:FMN-binding protein [Actinoplanes sp. LDG1-06]|uniref:FMN-binding protein n=1 Tax=Paractinoplanes ovalisporus TaxID=2810368 RepID=A0ABS2AJL2_9ACTN|nr:FMN-binding protein [Actinoplanes ovalisporus]MBM2619568.1 FMN-binding protein [Actinoplanes ovalisporus]